MTAEAIPRHTADSDSDSGDGRRAHSPSITIMEDRVASLDDDWRIVATGLAEGIEVVDGRVVVDAFLRVMEEWIRTRLVQGSAGDPRLRPRFGLLRDVHTAFDFLGEVLLERRSQLMAGNLNDVSFGGLGRKEGLGRLASSSWLLHRAKSFLGREAARGMVGMPEQDRAVASLDAGEEGRLGNRIEASHAAADADTDPRLELMRAVADGRPVLVLDLTEVGSSAIIATAGLQLRRRLDAPAPSTVRAFEEMTEALVLTEVAVERAHDAAAASHLERIRELQQRRWDHPNMSRRTAEGIDRQITQATAAALLWPIPGLALAELFGLPSENAGQKRTSNYRKALPILLPELAGSFRGLLDDDAPEGADT